MRSIHICDPQTCPVTSPFPKVNPEAGWESIRHVQHVYTCVIVQGPRCVALAFLTLMSAAVISAR